MTEEAEDKDQGGPRLAHIVPALDDALVIHRVIADFKHVVSHHCPCEPHVFDLQADGPRTVNDFIAECRRREKPN
jgi:hypothetical protein